MGAASIFVPKWGIEIHGITLHQKDGKRWINFPSRQYEKDGEKKYMPYFRFPNKDHYSLFCDAVKKAIERHAEKESLDKDLEETLLF